MKIHEVEQNSAEWLALRAGRITASELDALVTPLGKVKTGAGPRTYLMKKLAETWMGAPLATLENIWNLDQGKFLEEQARPAFTFETGQDVRKVGFITTDDGKVGCSPDGLIGANCGLEIKCPHLETAVGYLLDGVLPPEYVLQVQGSLWVTGFPRWMFYSYRRGLPSLVLTVEPDEKIQAAISESVEQFTEAFDAGLARLKELNGGVMPKPRDERAEAIGEFDDTIHDDRV